MRRSLVVGILRETKEGPERRTPLSPSDVLWLTKRDISVEVESSPTRIFKDWQYKRCKATVLNKFKRANLLIGVKEPRISDLYQNKIYLVFSHTIKGQRQNMPLLREFIKKKATLVDYEKIVDPEDNRLVHFGRFAGICGVTDSLYYLGKKLEWKGIENPFKDIRPAYEYGSLKELKNSVAKLSHRIWLKRFDKRIAPFIIGMTGHGHVVQGVREILELLHPLEIHPKDMLRFVRHQRHIRNKIYTIVFHREEKFRSKKGGGFYFEEYLKNPQKFESNMDRYLPHLNLLVHGSYWDDRYPRLVTKRMIHRLYGKSFRLEFIGDVSCDINGSIELTYKATMRQNPTFTYNPRRRSYVDGHDSKGITILAVDNLPLELPMDSSCSFSSLIRDYIYQIAAHGVKDLTDHVVLPREIREAVITQGGRLTSRFGYLRRYL